MFRACHAHHQEKQIVSIEFLVKCHSVLVAVSCAGWEFTPTQHTTLPPTWSDILPEAVLIQFVSPDDEHDMLETCREL